MSDSDQLFNRLFRFQLERKNVEEHSQALEELVRRHLQELLAIVELFEAGRKVEVDSFQFINEVNAQKPIYPSEASHDGEF